MITVAIKTTVKTTLLLIAFIFTIQMADAQSKSDKMYDAFNSKDGISSFTFSKNMIDAINLDLGDEGEEKNVTGDLHQVRFMSYNPEKGNLTGNEFIKNAISYLPKNSYNKLEDNDTDSDTEIWLSGGKKNFTECHVFVKNEDSNALQFVVSFYGDFTVNDIDKLKKSGKGFSKD
jgi:hypothetical protein